MCNFYILLFAQLCGFVMVFEIEILWFEVNLCLSTSNSAKFRAIKIIIILH